MTDRIKWKDSYRIGVPKIDAQHHRLVDMLGKLHDSLPRGLHNPTVGATIKEIVGYTQTHFKDEEELMRSINFELLDEHSQMHRDLLGKVANVLKALKAGEDFGANDLMQFLNDWVVAHMIEQDSKIGVAMGTIRGEANAQEEEESEEAVS